MLPLSNWARRGSLGLFALASLHSPSFAAANDPAACPATPTRVVMPSGNLDFVGTAAGIPELCRMNRPDGSGDYYFGIWKTNWPGAGDALPAFKIAVAGPKGTRSSFITRSAPGLQWNDSIINGGTEILVVDGRSYRTLKLAHEREGIEGNTYHSIITEWRDVDTGVPLKVVEDQISGESYGPGTTWMALQVQRLLSP
jgi:hypothetical protein